MVVFCFLRNLFLFLIVFKGMVYLVRLESKICSHHSQMSQRKNVSYHHLECLYIQWIRTANRLTPQLIKWKTLGDCGGGAGEIQVSADYFTCFFLFWGRVSCSSDWPPVCYAADLDRLAFSSLVLGIPVFATMRGLCRAGDLTQSFMHVKHTLYNQARS